MNLTISITEAKNRLTEMVRRVESGVEVTITKGRNPAAVMISWEVYQRLKRQLAAARLHRLRDSLAGSGLNAQEIYRESRKQLEGRS